MHTQVAFPKPKRVGEDSDCLGTWSYVSFSYCHANGLSLDPLLIVHTSKPSETHYYSISSPDRRILHTHNSAPYVPQVSASEGKAFDFSIYFSGSTGCGAELDWSATLRRWASRYATALISWAVGVVAFVTFAAWGLSNKGHGRYPLVFFLPTRLRISGTPAVHQSLFTHSCKSLKKPVLVSFLLSFFPLPVDPRSTRQCYPELRR